MNTVQLLAGSLTAELYSQFVSGQTVYSGSKSEIVSNETEETGLWIESVATLAYGFVWAKSMSAITKMEDK